MINPGGRFFERRHLAWYWALLFLLALRPNLAPCQELNFKQFTQAEGLPSNTIYCVVQDRQGFLWFGSDGGLSRFDGNTFQNFNVEDGLTDNEIFEIFEDSDDRLWLHTYNGVPCIYDHGTIRNPQNTAFLNELKGDRWITTVREDSKGSLFFSWFGSQCRELKPDSTVVDRSFANVIPAYPVRNIWTWNGDLWAGRGPDKVDNLSRGESYWLPFETNGYRCRYYPIGDRIVMSYSTSLVVLDREIQILKHHFNLFESEVITLYATSDPDVMMIGTRNGLLKVNIISGKILDRYLAEEVITGFQVDHEGGWWITTHEHGVFYSQNSDVTWWGEKYIPNLPVTTLGQYQGELWFGADNYTFGHIDPSGLQWRQPKRIHELGGRGRVFQFYQLNNQLFTIAENLLFQLDQSQDLALMSMDKKVRVLHTTDSVTLIGNLNGIYHWKEPTVDNLQEAGDVLYSIRVNAMANNGKNQLWAGTNTGLRLIDKHFNKVIWSVPELEGKRITSLATVDSNTLIVGTGGWGIYQLEHGQVKLHLEKHTGLPANSINRVYFDDEGLWMLTQGGLLHQAKWEGDIDLSKARLFSRGEGLPFDQVFDRKLLNDTLYLAGATGIAQLPWNSSDVKPFAPVLQALSVVAGKIKVKEGTTLDPDNNNLKAQLSAVSLSSFDVTFRYTLSPIEDSLWFETSSRELLLDRIYPGNYTLTVQARNSLSDWSEPQQVSFSVQKPLYQRSWFQFLLLGGLLSIIYGLFRLKLLLFDRKLLWRYLVRLVDRTRSEDKIWFRDASGDVNLPLSKIIWIKSDGNYCQIQTPEKTYLVLATLKSFEKRLSKWPNFYRVHRSWIINVRHIASRNRTQVTLQKTRIPIGETHQKEFREFIERLDA